MSDADPAGRVEAKATCFSLLRPSCETVLFWRLEKMHLRHISGFSLAGFLLIGMASPVCTADIMISDPHNNGSFLALPSLVTDDPSANQHRAVLYNHGGSGPLQEGGDLQKVVEMLAEKGFIAYAKKRSGTTIPETLDEVQLGVTELMNLTPDDLHGRTIVDGPANPGLSVFGYSRGALMSLRLAELQQDADDTALKIDKVILAAMAPGGGTWTNGGSTDPSEFTTADQYFSDGSVISTNNVALIDNSSTEFFMIDATNDRPPNNEYNDLVDLMTTANQRMSDRTDSEGNSSPVSSTLKIYESWMPPESGHNLFMKVVDGGQDLVNEPGYYSGTTSFAFSRTSLSTPLIESWFLNLMVVAWCFIPWPHWHSAARTAEVLPPVTGPLGSRARRGDLRPRTVRRAEFFVHDPPDRILFSVPPFVGPRRETQPTTFFTGPISSFASPPCVARFPKAIFCEAGSHGG